MKTPKIDFNVIKEILDYKDAKQIVQTLMPEWHRQNEISYKAAKSFCDALRSYDYEKKEPVERGNGRIQYNYIAYLIATKLDGWKTAKAIIDSFFPTHLGQRKDGDPCVSFLSVQTFCKVLNGTHKGLLDNAIMSEETKDAIEEIKNKKVLTDGEFNKLISKNPVSKDEALNLGGTYMYAGTYKGEDYYTKSTGVAKVEKSTKVKAEEKVEPTVKSEGKTTKAKAEKTEPVVAKKEEPEVAPKKKVAAKKKTAPKAEEVTAQ